MLYILFNLFLSSFLFLLQNKRKKQTQDSGRAAKKYKEFKFWFMLITMYIRLSEANITYFLECHFVN